MKKLVAAFAMLVFTLTACADRNQLINSSELPVQAKTFIQKYFNIVDVIRVEKERDGMYFDFNVYLTNAVEIEFDHQGNLESIDCHTFAIPDGIVPETIIQYISLHYPHDFIVEYEIGSRRIKVGLNSGIEAIFDMEGNFHHIDD